MIPTRNETLNNFGNMFLDPSTCEECKNLLRSTAIALCDEVFKDVSNYWFTDHGPKHSDAVFHYAIELAYNMQRHVKKFNEQEIFGLACACYLHDIGMAHIPNHLDLAVNGYSKKLIDKIRIWHVEAVDTLLPEKYADLEKIYNKFALLQTGLPLVCRAHGTKEHKKTCKEFVDRRDEFPDFRGDLLGKILLIADELNLDHSRANLDHPHADRFPVGSKAHMYKHYYVTNAKLCYNRLELLYSFPPELSKSGCDVFIKWNSSKLRKQIKLVQDGTLADIRCGFDLDVGNHTIITKPRKIVPDDVLDKAKEFADKKEASEGGSILKNSPNLFDPNRTKSKKDGCLNPVMTDLMDELFRELNKDLAKEFFNELYVEVEENEKARKRLLEITQSYISKIRSGKGTEPLQPFLITGRVGCGKSALIRSLEHKNSSLFETKLPIASRGGHIIVNIDCRPFKTRDEIFEQLLLELTRQCRRSKSIIWPSLEKAGWTKYLTEVHISSMEETDKLSKLRGIFNHLHETNLSGLKRAVPVILMLDNVDRIGTLQLRGTVVRFALREGLKGYPLFVIPLRNTTKNILDEEDPEFGDITSHPISAPSHHTLLSTRIDAAFSANLLANSKTWAKKQKIETVLNKNNLVFNDLRNICKDVMLALVGGNFVPNISGTNMRNALTVFRTIMKAMSQYLLLKYSRKSSDRKPGTHDLISVFALEGHPCYFGSRSKMHNIFSEEHGHNVFSQIYLQKILQILTVRPDDYISLKKWIETAVEIRFQERDIQNRIMTLIRGHFPTIEVEGYEDGIPDDYCLTDQIDKGMVRLTTTGNYFLNWLVNDFAYLDCVMQDTIMDADIAESLAKLRTKSPVELAGIFERVDVFLDYLEKREQIERATLDCSNIQEVVPEIRRRIAIQKDYNLKIR